MTIDYLVRFQKMPASVKECVTHNDDDSYTIFINTEINAEAQEKAFEHAINHIINDDFSKDDIQSIEANAHNNDIKIVDIFGVNKEG